MSAAQGTFCERAPWLPSWRHLLVLVLAFGVGLLGCATYGFAERGPPPDRQLVAVDRNAPQSSVRWSFLWGTMHDLWSPLTCAQSDAEGKCIQTMDPCDGHGAGQFETRLTWYSVPLALVTLGTVIPAELTVYCSTQEPPGPGP